MTSKEVSSLLRPSASFFSRDNSNSNKRVESLSYLQLVLLTCCMAGVQVSYAAQVNLGTPHLLLLGLSGRVVSFAWLAGPLSGLIIQPIIGRWSDKVGRRRPFLFYGAFITAFSMFLFANTHPGDSFALPIAIFAFFALDFSVQAVQAPLRMLVTDIVPQHQKSSANALLAFFTGVGLLLGGVMTGIQLEVYMPFFRSHTQALFCCSAFILVFTAVLCVLTTDEGAQQPQQHISNGNYQGVNGDANPDDDLQLSFQRVRNAPAPYWACFFVQLCTWVGFFTLFVYESAWVGTNIFGGDGSAPHESAPRKLFEEGVRLAGQANAFQAVVCIVYSTFIPFLWSKLGVRPVYVFSQLVQAASLLSAPFLKIHMKKLTVTIMALYGIVWASTMTIPWTLIGNALTESDEWYRNNVGIFQTLFNSSQSGPQLVVAILIAPVVLWLANDNPAWVMFAGGVSGALGAFLIIVFKIDLPYGTHYSPQLENENSNEQDAFITGTST